MANWHLENDAGNQSWICTLEPQDDEYVLTQLLQSIEEHNPIDYLPEKVEISIINPFTEDDSVVLIDTEPYLEKLRFFQMANRFSYKDFAKHLVDLDREIALKLSLELIEQLSQK